MHPFNALYGCSRPKGQGRALQHAIQHGQQAERARRLQEVRGARQARRERPQPRRVQRLGLRRPNMLFRDFTGAALTGSARQPCCLPLTEYPGPLEYSQQAPTITNMGFRERVWWQAGAPAR